MVPFVNLPKYPHSTILLEFVSYLLLLFLLLHFHHQVPLERPHKYPYSTLSWSYSLLVIILYTTPSHPSSTLLLVILKLFDHQFSSLQNMHWHFPCYLLSFFMPPKPAWQSVVDAQAKETDERFAAMMKKKMICCRLWCRSLVLNHRFQTINWHLFFMVPPYLMNYLQVLWRLLLLLKRWDWILILWKVFVCLKRI